MGGQQSRPQEPSQHSDHFIIGIPEHPYYMPEQPAHVPVPQQQPWPQQRFDRRYSIIDDQYHTVEQVVEALAQAGLESSNLIVGVDFNKSNERTGKYSFNGRSLHHNSDTPNPYEHAISIIGQTLSNFDDDNLIPCYGLMGGQQSSLQPPSQHWDHGRRSHPPQQQWNYDSGSLPSNYAVPYYMPEQPAHVPVPPVPSVPMPQQQRPQRRFDRRYSNIADQYHTFEQVVEALAQAGLESSNLIVGVDFSKSNEWTGKYSFNGRSLHHISDTPNPYEHAMSIIGQTLSNFDDNNLIPCFGFGDASTYDRDVFGFYPEDRPCNGFPEALKRYRELVPHVRLAGPTSFAPIVEMGMTIVEKSRGQYHVLLIIADGQVTRSVDTESGQLSPQEQMTVDAIVKASELPLSIVLVGVGDGPWDTMKEFNDNIPARSFDNFQFVNFTEIMSKNLPQRRKEAEFALRALMEIPLQYKATLDLGILGRQSGRSPNRVALLPPVGTFNTAYTPAPEFSKPTASPYPACDSFETSASASFSKPTAPEEPSLDAQQFMCPICLVNPKNMAFGCGHQTCVDCSQNLQLCPICRTPIQTRLKLY